MKVLVTGANGQLGTDLVAHFNERAIEVLALTAEQVDFVNTDQLRRVITEARADWVVNCAAYTQVDKAESEPDLVYRINAEAAGVIAQAVSSYGGRLLQVSTDFVFDGARSTPYLENDKPAPLGVYGDSKYQGELQVQQYCQDAIILRTSWVFGAAGHNFVKTILRLCRSRDCINVVDDQRGSPAWTRCIAIAIDALLAAAQPGIYHFSNSGVTNWYRFAVEIVRRATALGLLEKACDVKPISTGEYPTAAQRPPYSALATDKIARLYPGAIPRWETALESMLVELQHV